MFKYAFPIWISMCLSTLLGVVDFVYLIGFSKAYYTIAGVGFVPFALMTIPLAGLGIQANRYCSANQRINLYGAFLHATLISASFTLVAQLLLNHLFFFYQGEYLNRITEFFSIITWSLIPLSWIMLGTGILRGQGCPRRQLPFSVLVLIANVVLDYLLIYPLGIFPTKACALATTLSDWLIAGLMIGYLIRRSHTSERFPHRDFLKHSLLYGLEKLFSTGSLVVLANIFAANFTLTNSSLYFAWHTYTLPIMMFAHAYFEWVIYKQLSSLQKAQLHHLLVYSLVALCYVTCLGFAHHSVYTGLAGFNALYVAYIAIFFLNRTVTAVSFNRNRANIPLRFNALFRAGLILTLYGLQVSGNLNLMIFIAMLVLTEGLIVFSCLYDQIRQRLKLAVEAP